MKCVKDGRIIIANRWSITAVLKVMDTYKVVSKLRTKDLESNFQNDFLSLDLVEDDKYLIALSERRIHKLSLIDIEKIEPICQNFPFEDNCYPC